MWKMYLLKNNTLEERRKTVDEKMKNFKENSDIKLHTSVT